MRNRDIEQHVRDTAEDVGGRAREYANDASNAAQGLFERGRRRIRERFGNRGHDYRRQVTRATEDFADEANYQYRRLRRQVNRHPAATVAIVAGTVGAFLLLYRAFSSRENDED